MKGRRQFFKVFFGSIVTIIILKYSKIINAMNNLPYHHMSDGTFRNLPGSPKRISERSGNFFRFFYKGIIKKEMFDQKEVPDNIPVNHFIEENEALSKFRNNKDEISITWLGHASFLIRLGNQNHNIFCC